MSPVVLRRQPPVIERVLPQLRVEHFAGLPQDGTRVAVVAQFSKGPRVTPSLEELLRQLLDGGYHVILVSASPTRLPLRLDPGLCARMTLLRKPNIGYDFGSWATALAWDRRIASVNNVIFTNDSLAGPFVPLAPILRGFEGSQADVYALTDNTQFGRHLQSYFLGFRRGVLREAPLARFWDSIQHMDDKERIVLRNEVGLSRLLRREAFAVEVAFPHVEVVNAWQNPTIDGWARLLNLGFPFVKRELLRRPELVTDGARIPDVLREKFGVKIEEWT